jgi:hypothetical protein
VFWQDLVLMRRAIYHGVPACSACVAMDRYRDSNVGQENSAFLQRCISGSSECSAPGLAVAPREIRFPVSPAWPFGPPTVHENGGESGGWTVDWGRLTTYLVKRLESLGHEVTLRPADRAA